MRALIWLVSNQRSRKFLLETLGLLILLQNCKPCNLMFLIKADFWVWKRIKSMIPETKIFICRIRIYIFITNIRERLVESGHSICNSKYLSVGLSCPGHFFLLKLHQRYAVSSEVENQGKVLDQKVKRFHWNINYNECFTAIQRTIITFKRALFLRINLNQIQYQILHQ